MFNLPLWCVNVTVPTNGRLYSAVLFVPLSIIAFWGFRPLGWNHSEISGRQQDAKWKIFSPLHDYPSLLRQMWPDFHPLHPTESAPRQVIDNLLTAKSQGCVSVLILMSLLKDLSFDHSSLYHTLPPWIPEQNLGLTFLLLSESSSALAGASLSTCPSHIACLQGDKRSPLCFIPCVHSEETHDIYVSVITSMSRTVLLAYVSVPSLIRSPWTPFFLHFNTHRVLSFIYCAIWFEFAFPPFTLLLPLYRPLSSLPWTICTRLLLASLLSLVFCLQPTLNTPTSAISKTKRLQWLPFAQGRKFKFLSLILTLGLVSNPASYHPPVVIFPPLVQKG